MSGISPTIPVRYQNWNACLYRRLPWRCVRFHGASVVRSWGSGGSQWASSTALPWCFHEVSLFLSRVHALFSVDWVQPSSHQLRHTLSPCRHWCLPTLGPILPCSHTVTTAPFTVVKPLHSSNDPFGFGAENSRVTTSRSYLRA